MSSFVSTKTGIIQNINHNANAGNSVGFNTDLTTGGQVVSFENHGTIIGDATAGGSVGVGFFDDSNGLPSAFQVGIFLNTGTISGSSDGIASRAGFGSFTNTGTISGNTG